MKKLKKLAIIVFAMVLGFTLQLNTSLKQGVEDGFSISKLAGNLLVKNAYADWTWYWHKCPEGWVGGGFCDGYQSAVGCLDPFNDCSESS